MPSFPTCCLSCACKELLGGTCFYWGTWKETLSCHKNAARFPRAAAGTMTRRGSPCPELGGSGFPPLITLRVALLQTCAPLTGISFLLSHTGGELNVFVFCSSQGVLLNNLTLWTCDLFSPSEFVFLRPPAYSLPTCCQTRLNTQNSEPSPHSANGFSGARGQRRGLDAFTATC